MRGVRGIGTNRINKYMIRKATQGLANYMFKCSEKEAKEKIKSVIQTGKAYCEFERLVTNQKGNLKLFFEKYNEENSRDNGIELKAGFDRNNRKNRCIKGCKSSI